MRLLVTGGAGYIGAHTCLRLRERGDEVTVVDDLVTGSRARLATEHVEQLDLASDEARSRLASLMRARKIEAVIHFAARKQVSESVQRPAWYHQQNVGGIVQLLLAMEDAGVERLVFSSSAAVYGAVDGAVDEATSTDPVNPYGQTKLVGERLISDVAAASGLRAASLRYFNVGGALRPELGDTEILNLIPITFDRLQRGLPPIIFGDDYPTPDGTCIRDYVHVADVADAHLAVLDTLPAEPGHVAYNVGTGQGTSVLSMVDRILTVAGSDLAPVVVERRAGDPASVVAAVDRIRRDTGWSARHGLDDIIESAWAAWRYATAARDGAGPASNTGVRGTRT